MNNKKYSNLKPWKPGQSGNPAGRKPGSKNISTIVRELLDQEASVDALANSSINDLVRGAPTSYAQAVVYATVQKALQGNMQAVIWLAERQEQELLGVTQQELFKEQPAVVSVIKPRNQSTVD